ncbi:ketoacyl-synt-domain-containing protein [Lojkania enalia]|uniref:Ketoacyl-synt-domain-containing protein n=1 Tax=Lojkania enalia TaxID=147567 RepID=A0A9P4K9B1_9PLEO|nr:ketoacyl-synt-domain-containing protein [Didymosphaeria enalia]
MASTTSTESISDGASELDGNNAEPIAIIGFAFKFPQEADTPEGFWKMLLEKRCVMTDFPEDRMSVKGHYRKEKKQTTLQLKGGHFIKEEMAAFDANFFSISPTEALALDPMQRWLLEVSYHAFENAGLPIETVANSATSVHTGSFAHDYMIQTTRDVEQFPTYAGYGLGAAMLANRISWFYNLTGPSIAVDSACSSSAMALDMSCQSLRTRSSNMGLVAGCNLTFSPETFAWLSNMNMLSPDSKSYSFDHRANGYARGEGIAVMVVKRLEDAIRDGNTIRAVIRSTGANEDGHTSGITQPSQMAQEQLIKETYERAGLSMEFTRYCEAHGTGTPLGDPLEATAIGNSFRSYRSEEEPLYVGSVKSNIGHLEGSSGLAGVIKVVLALESGLIPPNANFEKINPMIDTKHLRIRIPSDATPWPSPGLRRASINSFGYGGANCHIVLDDAYNYLKLRGMKGTHKTAASPPAADESKWYSSRVESPASRDSSADTRKTPKLLVLSASDEAGIQRLATSYEAHFAKNFQDGDLPPKILDAVAYTLDSHRSVLTYRSSSVAHSLEDLLRIATTASMAVKPRGTPLQLGFVFTGQGAQWFAMGRELLDYPVYRKSVDDASIHLASLGCPWSALDELNRGLDSTKVDEYSQALCTVIQVALVDLLNEVNIKPSAVVGHSSGEIAAAYAAGYISKQDAWKIAYFRGIVASKLSSSYDHGSGAMIAIGLPEEEVLPHIADILSTETSSLGLNVACINSPKNVTVAGDRNLIHILKHRLDQQNVFARELRVKVAYHSKQMQAVADEYLNSIGANLKSSPTQYTVPMISSVSGKIIGGDDLRSPGYWAQNMVSPVLFSPAVLEMCTLSRASLGKDTSHDRGTAWVVDYLVEVGPHSALQGPLRDILKSLDRGSDIGYSSVLVRGEAATKTLLNAAGALWCTGHPVNIRAVNELDVIEGGAQKDSTLGMGRPRILGGPEMLIDLPAYPFDHTEKYWFESRISKAYRFRDRVPQDLLGSRCSDWSPLDARWRMLIRERDLPWTADHLVNGRKVYPGTGMLIMAIEGAKQLADPERIVSGFVLRNVEFESAMDLEGPSGTLEVLTSLRPSNSDTRVDSRFNFSISSYTDPDWVRNCRGSIEIEYEKSNDDWNAGKRMDHLNDLASKYQKKIEDCNTAVDKSVMYQRLKNWGLDYGPAFQIATTQMVSTNSEAIADVVTFKGDGEELQPHVIHPVTFDAIGHLCFTAFTAGGIKPMATSMPQKLNYAWISDRGLAAPDASSVRACSTIVGQTPRGFEGDCVVFDAENSKEVRLFIQGLKLAFISDIPRELELPNRAQQWYNIERKVDLSMLSWSEVEQYLRGKCKTSAGPMELAYQYIELAAHQNPGMRVCQIDAGNGDNTRRIFEHALDLNHSGYLSCARYSFADRAQTNVEHAKESFAKYGAKMKFHVFDPVYGSQTKQSEVEDYDMIIAFDHSWTLKNMQETFENLRKTLKPGGKMVIERPALDDGVVVDWNEVLHRSGFSGVNLYLEPSDTAKGIIISTAVEETTSHQTIPGGIRIIVVGNFANDQHDGLAKRVGELVKPDVASDIVQMSLSEASQYPDLKSSLLIILSDPEHLCLETLRKDSLSQLQRIIPTVPYVLWVSDMAAEIGIGGSPVSAIIEGSARSLRFEHNDTRLVTLGLESFNDNRSARHIFQVVERILSTPAGSNYEQEYVEVGGYLSTDRIVEAAYLRQITNAKLVPQQSTTVRLEDQNFKLGIAQIGNLETLRYVQEAPLSTEPRPGEVEIQVSAVAIESRDYRRAMGKTQKVQFGNACAGTIGKAGLHSGFNIGDRVFYVGKNTFKSRIRTPDHYVRKLPDGLDFADCCLSIPALAAAHHALVDVGRWREGDTVLIYPCAGFIGKAALRVCQKVGAPVWTTVHEDGQSRTLSEQLGIPGTSILSHDAFALGHTRHHPTFHGADIVLCTEPVPNDQSWDFVNKFGRVIYMPCITGAPILSPSFQHIPPNISYGAVNFQEIAAERPISLRESITSAFEILLADGGGVQTAAPFPASQVVEAFKRVGNTNGQVVVKFDVDDEIELTCDTQPTTKLDADASYLISGGTGGIGRGIARWCAARGARYLILLSRSGAKGREAQELVEELAAQGVHVEAPPCDVADEKALRVVLDDCAIRMPPIKGCIQASGAFKDISFEKMSLDDWNVAIKSKVTASWNLHKALPAGMDFFVMTSSMSGILGMISQSSYAGGNVYQDALARHRIALGEKAAALDLGVLQDVGFLTEAQKERLNRMGYFVFNYEAEIHALLDIFCDPANAMLTAIECRPITGFKTTAQMVADGVEVPFTFGQPLWRHTQYAHVEETKKSRVASTGFDVRGLIESAETMAQATAIATGALRKRVAVLLSTQEERLVESSAMHSYGIDSLVAIELRNWSQKTFGVEVAVFEIVGGASFVGVGMSIATKIRGGETERA